MSPPYVKLCNKPVDRWKVTELREELKRRRLTTTGLKPDLVRRLDEAVRIEMEDEENASSQSEVPVENEIADTNMSERIEDVTNKGIDIVAKVDPKVGVRRDSSSADLVQGTKSAGLEGEQVPEPSVVETTEVDKTAEPPKTKSNLQDYPCTTPLHSRYPRRSSRGVVPRFLASPSSGGITLTPPLKSALRIIRGDRAEAALPSQPTGDDPVFDNGVEDVKPSTSTGSTRISDPLSEHEMDLDALCAKITSQVEGSQQVALQPPSHQDVDGNTQPLGQNSEVPRDVHVLGKITTSNHVPPSSQCLTPSHSVNMTEFARRLEEESDDDHDEVVSAPSLDYDYINGHKVKIGIAPLVRAIFEKYGDITKECKIKTPPSFFSFLLERMCDVYQTLEKKNLITLTRDEINVMRDELQLCEDHKLNVGWLLERLEQISETTSSSKEYLMLKEEASKRMESNRNIKGDVELNLRRIASIQKNISTWKQQMVENQAVANKCTQKAIDIKTRVNTLQNQSLVHGLL